MSGSWFQEVRVFVGPEPRDSGSKEETWSILSEWVSFLLHVESRLSSRRHFGDYKYVRDLSTSDQSYSEERGEWVSVFKLSVSG